MTGARPGARQGGAAAGSCTFPLHFPYTIFLHPPTHHLPTCLSSVQRALSMRYLPLVVKALAWAGPIGVQGPAGTAALSRDATAPGGWLAF